MGRSTFEIVTKLRALPEPVIELYYYDGPLHFFAVVDGLVLLFSAASKSAEGRGWLIGSVHHLDVGKVMTGDVPLADFIRTNCMFWGLESSDGTLRVSTVQADQLEPDFLPEPEYRIHFTFQQACAAYEALISKLWEPSKGSVVYVAMANEQVPASGLKVFDALKNLIAGKYEALRHGVGAALRPALPSMAGLQASVSLSFVNSLAFRIVIAPPPSSPGNDAPAQAAIPEIAELVREVLQGLDSQTPTDTQARNLFPESTVTKAKELVKTLADTQTDVRIAAIQHTGDKIDAIAPASVTPAKSEEWRQVLQRMEPSPPPPPERLTAATIRGRFRLVTDLDDTKFQFQPDWEAPESAQAKALFRKPPKLLSGDVDADTSRLISQFNVRQRVIATFTLGFIGAKRVTTRLDQVSLVEPR